MRTDINLDEYRKLLETQRSAIQQRMDQESKSLRAYSDPNPDLLDAATKTSVQERRVGWINYLKGRQNQINEAMQRLDTGKFGVCTRCGKFIEIDRLKVKPYARYCVRCKVKIEQRRR